MEDTTRTDTAPPTGTPPRKSGRGVLWAVLGIVLAFAAGYGWQFYEATTVREELTAVEAELAMERLRVRLGQAALAAQAGDYEAARRQMSQFFTRLQEEAESLTPEVGRTAQDFLAMRDDVITGLSRSNPEYAGVLYGMLEQLGNAIDRGSAPVAPPADGLPAGEADTEPGDAEPAAGTGGGNGAAATDSGG